MLLSPFHSHEEEDRREAARLERGMGGGESAAGREDVLRDGVHIPELQASHPPSTYEERAHEKRIRRGIRPRHLFHRQAERDVRVTWQGPFMDISQD